MIERSISESVPVIAIPQLLYPEPILSSAFFLKKKAPFAESQRARELWNRSNLLAR
jgi:hypothetical protein